MTHVIVAMEALSLLVELVILLGNIFGTHSKNVKNRMYMLSVIFFMLATAIDCLWNKSGSFTHHRLIGLSMNASTYIYGITGLAFLGYYLIAVIDSRKKVNTFHSLVLCTLSIMGIIFVIWGTITGNVFYYLCYHIFKGEYYVTALYFVLFIGLYEVFIIVHNSKILGFQDTFVMLSYFILPVMSLIVRLTSESKNYIFPAMSVSFLIINNFLNEREKNEAIIDKELARKSEQNKSEFLANMSHEIRTPINAVLGLNELILRESTEQTIKGYASDIKSSGNQLLNLVNDVLDFSKIESGKMTLVPVNYGISSLLNDVANMISIKAEEKGLDFIMEVDPSVPRSLIGDEIRLKQIIVNIMNNAVKYTKTGHVKLDVSYEKTELFAINLTISVEDTGVGMKPEDIDKLYKPFERIDEANNRNIEGTGLGMAITKHFLDLMDSQLQVESEYGKGSTFKFTVRQEVENWECMGDYKEAFHKLHENESTYQAKLKAPNAQILVVDDMPMNLTVCKGLLKPTLIKVDTATSGEEALELMEYNKFDIIFLDHMMPGIDGIETLKRHKANRTGKNIDTPVIILTANAVAGARDEYIKVGFDDYLTKPIDPTMLEKTLINYLPEELVILAGDEGYDDVTVELETGGDELSLLRNIPNLSVEEGIKNSGGEKIYLSVAEEFALTSENSIAAIERYFNAEDLHNYEVQVHGLKTTARLIGDIELSDLAREMEFAAKDEDIDLIYEKTGKLLEKYNELYSQLKSIFIKELDDGDLEAIDADELSEAVNILKQAVEEFDADMIESVMDQLLNYRLPDDFKPVYEKLRVCIANVDFDGMTNILNKL